MDLKNLYFLKYLSYFRVYNFIYGGTKDFFITDYLFFLSYIKQQKFCFNKNNLIKI